MSVNVPLVVATFLGLLSIGGLLRSSQRFSDAADGPDQTAESRAMLRVGAVIALAGAAVTVSLIAIAVAVA